MVLGKKRQNTDVWMHKQASEVGQWVENPKRKEKLYQNIQRDF